MTAWEWVGAAWTAFWALLPFASFPVGVVLFSRQLQRIAAGEGFAAEFIPFAADVAKIEATLPKMPGAVI